MKVQISINDELLERVDAYAKKTYSTRSGVISQACTSFLTSSELSFAIKDMALSMRKIADTGCVDEETQEKLEDFERFSKLLKG